MTHESKYPPAVHRAQKAYLNEISELNKKFFLLVAPGSKATGADIEAALADGADVNARNEKGETAIYLAAQELLRATRMSHLHHAGSNVLKEENRGVIQALLEAGADISELTGHMIEFSNAGTPYFELATAMPDFKLTDADIAKIPGHHTPAQKKMFQELKDGTLRATAEDLKEKFGIEVDFAKRANALEKIAEREPKNETPSITMLSDIDRVGLARNDAQNKALYGL